MAKKFIGVEEATFQSLAKDVVRLQQEINTAKQDNRNIIIGVVVAAVLIVAAVAVEVIIFHTRVESSVVNNNAQIYDVEKAVLGSITEIQKEIINLKKMPPLAQ